MDVQAYLLIYLEIFLPDSVGLVPLNLGAMYSAISQPSRCQAFQFTPPSLPTRQADGWKVLLGAESGRVLDDSHLVQLAARPNVKLRRYLRSEVVRPVPRVENHEAAVGSKFEGSRRDQFRIVPDAACS